MTLKSILPLAALALPLAVAAQTTTKVENPAVNVQLDFEPNSAALPMWTNLGVYDTWEASPFRTGKLAGNVAVVDNPTLAEIDPLTGKPVNPSSKVIALQRSRFGSNTFGAWITLREPIALSPNGQLFIHAWVRSPKAGRVLIAGLGKRKERTAQVNDVVQVAHITTSALEVNQWKEIVVPAQANKGVELHSLLIVPDCESPHDLTQDFVAYIDNVSVTNSASPSLITGYYPINFDKQAAATRNDRHIDAVDFTIAGKKVTYTLPQPAKVYREVGPSFRLSAQPGQLITPYLHYTGNAMHSYFYVDLNQDGTFTENEALSYSCYNNKNSKGVSKQPGSALQSPSFKLPDTMKPGVYRLRLKVDYNSLDPKGHQTLVQDGGGFVDFLLNVNDGSAVVNDHNLNGAVKTVDGKELTSLKVPYGKDFTIKMHPADGFEHNGFVLKHGMNIEGDSLVKDNVQWESITIPRSLFKADGTFTIPGKWMDGNVLIEGRFVQEGRYVPEPVPAWYSRFNVTSLDGKYFAPHTQWYSLQLGEQGYVIEGTKDAQIPLSATAVDAQNQQHLWCFVGNNDEGFKLYNRHFGTGFVLAAPTMMNGKQGGSSFVRLVPADKVPKNYTAVWHFVNSSNLKAPDAQVVYMYEDKLPANKVNNRDGKLSFWTGGADAGSTFVIRPVTVTDTAVTAIALPSTNMAPEEAYDLSGRHADKTARGVFVMAGKKVVR